MGASLKERVERLGLDLKGFAKYFDHTILKPEAKREDVLRVIEEAKEWGFSSVCVNPAWVRLCAKELSGTGIKVCTVVGFPLGATSTYAKVSEALAAVADGAEEIDMVLNIGYLKSGLLEEAMEDVKAVKEAIGNRVLKVIIECCLLSDEEKRTATELVIKAGADFVKTSTGFSISGATVEDVKLLKETAKGKIKVKAAGGIKTLEKALSMIEAGADRIGASSSHKIMKELKEVYG